MKFIFVFIFVLSLVVDLSAKTFVQWVGAGRSFPQSASGEVQVYYNEKIWSGNTENQIWKYGFWRMGAYAALHGQMGGKIEVYPISIWQISLQKSVTSRFYDTKTLDCKQIECRGNLYRGTLKTSLVLGYENFFLVPSFSVTNLNHESESQNFSSEDDNLIADKTGDQLSVMQLAIGYKIGDDRWILLNKSSKMKFTKDENLSQYFIWNRKLDSELSVFAGGGTYDSNHAERGISLVAGITWLTGEDLSLF